MIFLQADIIANRIGCKIDSNEQPLHEWDYYSMLFQKERETFEKRASEQELEEYKEKRRRRFEEFNQNIRNRKAGEMNE